MPSASPEDIPALGFLGLGTQPPTPSWGEILSQSRDYIHFAWWLTLFPGLAIFVTITAYNLIGEGLRMRKFVFAK